MTTELERTSAPSSAGRTPGSRSERNALPGADFVAAHPDLAIMGALSLAWVVAVLVTDLRGNFSENDSWAYAQTTRRFLETGEIVRSPWTFAPVITNVLIGSAFAKVFGFSSTVLRVSSAFMGGIGVLGSYGLGRVLGCGRAVAALAALAVGFSPLYFALSCTFMTDVPFTTCTILSFLGFALALNRRYALGHVVGFAAAGAAIMSRQPGAVLLPALTVTYGLSRLRSMRAIAYAAIGGIAFVVALLTLDRLLLGASRLGISGALGGALFGGHRGFALTSHGLMSMAQMGLVGLPLVVAIAFSRQSFTRREIGSGAVIAVCALVVYVWKFRHRPFGGNVLSLEGIGPLVLHCATERPTFASWSKWLTTGVGLASGGLALAAQWSWLSEIGWRERRERPAALLLPLFGLFYFVPVVLRSPFFDRYLIPVIVVWLIPLAVILHQRLASRRALLAGGATLLLITAYGVGGTADYLDHLRTRQALLEPLVNRPVPPQLIEGGFEFDGETRDASGQLDRVWLTTRIKALGESRGSGWSGSEAFVVSSCPTISGFHELGSRVHRRYLPPREERLYLHERTRPKTQ